MEKEQLIYILSTLTRNEEVLCACLTPFDAGRAVDLCDARARYRKAMCNIEDLDVLFFKTQAQITAKPLLTLYLRAFLEEDRWGIKEMAAQIDEEIDELKTLLESKEV